MALIRNLPKFTSSVWFLVVITDENGHLSQMLNYDNLNNKITVPIYYFTLVSSRSMNVKIFHLTFPRFPSRFVHRTGTTFWNQPDSKWMVNQKKEQCQDSIASMLDYWRMQLLPDKQKKVLLWVYWEEQLQSWLLQEHPSASLHLPLPSKENKLKT